MFFSCEDTKKKRINKMIIAMSTKVFAQRYTFYNPKRDLNGYYLIRR